MHGSYCALDDVGVFEVTGADARSFLHGQLTVDLNALPADRAPLAAWSAANGRVRALVRVVPEKSGYVLLTPASMAEALLTKLRMFVLRADVAIAASPTRKAAAVLGAAPDWLAAQGLAAMAERDRVERTGELTWIRIGARLVDVLGPEPALSTLAGKLARATRAAVELAEIEQGLPCIVPETAEQFLPQMLDLDRLGAVAFDKGCYPGQEVIARTQNLGTVKRRLRRFAAAGAAPAAGTPLVTPGGEEAGRVLRAAETADGAELLAVVRLEAAASPLHCASPDTPPLTERPFERNA